MQPGESRATLNFSEAGYDLEKQSYWFGRRWSFRVWQVILFFVVVLVIIAVLALLIAMFGPGNVDLKYDYSKGTAHPDKVTESTGIVATTTSSKETVSTSRTSTPSTPRFPTPQTSTAQPSTTATPTTGTDKTPLYCSVAIVGGGTGGLLMADLLLQSKNETNVCVFEQEDRLGGRIFDYFFFKAPSISVGLGIWNIQGGNVGEMHLYAEYAKVGFANWKPTLKRIEARGIVADSNDNLKSKAFPTLLNRYPFNSLSLFYVAQYVGGNDHAPSKNVSQFATAGTHLSYYLSPEGAKFLEDIYGFSSDYMQAANPESYRTYLDRISTLMHNPDDNSRPALGMSELITRLNQTIQSNGGKVFTRQTVKSISKNGDGFVIQTTNFTVRANKTVLAVGPSAVKKIHGNIGQNISSQEIFKSIVSVPQFEGAAVYSTNWWNDSIAHQKNNSLRPLEMYISNSDCLGVTMPYRGRGLNGTFVLHTMSNSGTCSDKWGNILKLSKSNMDKEMKRALEHKFGREVPDPLDTAYKYWDEGVWFLQRPGTKFTVAQLHQWARRPLAGTALHIVGDAYNNFGGWLQDTVESVNGALNDGWNLSLPFDLY